MKPKLSILDSNPTPLQYLSGLSQELFREIYIKRDDLTPFGGGGNKLRKLEYLMMEAMNSQATTIVTVGAPQTNHGRLTAAIAAKFGLKCIIVAVGDSDGELSGNLLLDGILGARVVLKHDDGRDQDVQLEETVKKVMAAELKKGERGTSWK
ncbi:pyridoxal-phosphate dependent enzyme, partial [uncultured Megasphaera sp.]|uniref:pyridoxal-phosphate dependent enzyme n=1 Tax=uncultured Megasphaera sp. TaxID=165188 RepID=UPI0025DF5976